MAKVVDGNLFRIKWNPVDNSRYAGVRIERRAPGGEWTAIAEYSTSERSCDIEPGYEYRVKSLWRDGKKVISQNAQDGEYRGTLTEILEKGVFRSPPVKSLNDPSIDEGVITIIDDPGYQVVDSSVPVAHTGVFEVYTVIIKGYTDKLCYAVTSGAKILGEFGNLAKFTAKLYPENDIAGYGTMVGSRIVDTNVSVERFSGISIISFD